MTRPTKAHTRFAAFFARDTVEVARAIIGARFLVNGVGGIIVETEAYRRDDPASHSFAGMRPRNRSMFGPPGIAYVYRSYGVHWCLNFVCGEAGHGAAVLIRALEPTDGIAAMQKRRGLEPERLLCAGPGRLTQALGITDALDGKPLDAPPFALTLPGKRHETVTGVRIGITKAMEQPWRFGLAGSRFFSRGFRD